MQIALFPNEKKANSFQVANAAADFLKEKGVNVYTTDQFAKQLAIPALDPSISIDFLLSIGGDGTILQLFHHYHNLKAPIIGINLGGLGFLADIPLDHLFEGLQELIDGKFTIDKRIYINGQLNNEQEHFAINDIVIHRAQNKSIIDLAIFVDGIYLNTFASDGIIIATPSGSTAYSLACGGPILTPELEALVLTPISPHTISNRPIVLMPKKQIEIKYISQKEPIEVTFDGIESFPLCYEQSLFITCASEYFSLINLNSRDYFSTLRTKLDWKGRLRLGN